MLFEAGAVSRLGTVAEGTTVSDHEPDEQERAMSINAALACFEHGGREINLIDTPGEPSFVADAIAALRVADAAVVVVNGVTGVEVHTERLWQRADAGGLGAAGLRQHARPRARRLLPRPRFAQGRLRPARRRHRDPDRRRAGGERGDRPDRPEGVRLRGNRAGRGRGGGDSGRAARPGRGVPREADGRGGGELRPADGALPRGRGDRPRRDRAGAEAGRHRGPDLPRHLRRRDAQPRHRPPARGAGRGPALAGDARRRRGERARR